MAIQVLPFMDVATVGSQFFFRRDPQTINNVLVKYPWEDWGLVEPLQPNFDLDIQELIDDSSGTRRVAEKRPNTITESYDLTVKNIAPYILSYYFLDKNPPSLWQQDAVVNRALPINAHRGALFKLVDLAGEEVWNVPYVSGVYEASVTPTAITVTDISVSNSVATLTLSASLSVAIGDVIIAGTGWGTGKEGNARTYLVNAVSTGATLTATYVGDAPVATTGVTVPSSHVPAANAWVQGTDWEIYHVARGIIRFLPTSSKWSDEVPKDLVVVYSAEAIPSGYRMIEPLTASAPISGDMAIIWNSDDATKKRARIARAQVAPASSSLGVTDYSSVTFRLEVLTQSDVVEAPAGRFIQYLGALPTRS